VRRALIALLLFAGLSIVHTWPLASAPATLSRNDSPDTVLNEWILAWDAHQAVHDPAHFFDANIFYPDRHTLAYSEYLIGPAIMGAPLLWLGASPVLVYNLLLLAGLTLMAWATWCVITRWTGDWLAGLVAGSIVGFNAHTLTRMPHLQALHFEFFLVALVAFDLILSGDRRRAPLLLAIAFALQGLTSYYALVMQTIALVVALAVRLASEGSPAPTDRRRVFAQLAIAAGIALVLMLPFLLMYHQLGEVRDIEEVALNSATWREYLNTPARIYASWSPRFWGGPTALFPGFIALALSVVSLVNGTVVKDVRARMVAAFGLAAVALSCGAALPGYAWLYRVFVPLQGIRNISRFGFLAIVSAGLLSGFTVARLRRAWVTVALVVFVNVEAFSAPIAYTRAAPIPRLAAQLRDPNAVVAHFPFFDPFRVFHNADYMLESTANWRPMLNGYSGIVPNSYEAHARELAHFPDDGSIAALRRYGVTHVWVHDKLLRDWTDNETADAVRTQRGLQFIAEEGDLKLYRVRRSDEE